MQTAAKTVFLISVDMLCLEHELHAEDKAEGITGHYLIDAYTEDEALDSFHEKIPIKVIDDFFIEIAAPRML